ncbi:MAG: hypothetical protein AAGD09_14060 [Cyanobacteria bacterium P01_F01_bin.56]
MAPCVAAIALVKHRHHHQQLGLTDNRHSDCHIFLYVTVMPV